MIIVEQSTEGLQIVRDDLYPFLYGGNKARKAKSYEKELLRGGFNALVTTGGVQSNHCRAIALLAARNGWDCHIVYHGSEERFFAEAGNASLVRRTNATYEFVSATEISSAMDRSMDLFASRGKHPYYVTGGGHDLSGGMAYVNAVEELIEEVGVQNLRQIKRVFLPCGTGSTYAGILVGLYKNGFSDIDVIGISVARNKLRATEVTSEFTNRLCKESGVSCEVSKKVVILDDYLMGGYERTTTEVVDWLSIKTKETGIVFDPTYSGKAFYGMTQYTEQLNLKMSENLFWHTGGIFNTLI